MEEESHDNLPTHCKYRGKLTSLDVVKNSGLGSLSIHLLYWREWKEVEMEEMCLL